MLKQVAALSALTFAVFLFVISFEGAVDEKDLGHAPRVQTSALDERTMLPLGIQNLAARSYDGGKIQIVDRLGTNSFFASYIISFMSDGLTQYALMNIPSNVSEGRAPVVIVNHGYVPPEDYSTENSYKNITDYYASNGFLVLKPDYRGYGKSETDNAKSTSVNRISYVVDVMNLLSSIKLIPEADSDRVFLYGHSMGGLVALEVSELSNNVKGVSLWAPVSVEYPESILYFVRLKRPDEYEEVADELNSHFTQSDYYDMSALNFTNLISAPVIIHHGTSDESVPYSWSVVLEQLLSDNKVTHTFYSYSRENHNFTNGSWATLARRDVDFFKSLFPSSR